ncbi:MAG: DNA translocase FtsK, partial [bacterium]|nr:DNA translocase FtsK [bacterium]
GETSYDTELEEKIQAAAPSAGGGAGVSDANERDAYFADAARLLIDKDKGSIGMLQRYFKIGFNRAARIMDQLEEAGIVGPEEGTKPRKVIMGPEEFEQYQEEYL